MKLIKTLMILVVLAPAACLQSMAQDRNEIALGLGAGSLRTQRDGGSTAVFSFSYQFHITNHFSVEGALDAFYYKFLTSPPDNPYIFKDGYLGAEAAVVYHFLPSRQTRRLLPFVVGGIGKTTTDFTEIAAHLYYRLGVGATYYLTDRLGFRLEARDEIIKSLAVYGNPDANLPSIRCGILYRF